MQLPHRLLRRPSWKYTRATAAANVRHPATERRPKVRQIGFALRPAGLVALLLVPLCSCRQHGQASSRTSNPAGTTITALIWAPDWAQQILQIAAEFTKLNPDIQVNEQFMIGDSVEENIKPRIASGNLPDLLSVNPNADAAKLADEVADEGILADVGATSAWNNILGHVTGAIIKDRVIVDYTNAVSRYPVTSSPCYSELDSNSIPQLHRLMRDVLLRKITLEQAAKLLDESVKNQAAMHYR